MPVYDDGLMVDLVPFLVCLSHVTDSVGPEWVQSERTCYMRRARVENPASNALLGLTMMS